MFIRSGRAVDVASSRWLWLPAALFVGLSLLSTLLWKALDLREQAQIKSNVHEQAGAVAARVETDLRTRSAILQRIAGKWEGRRGLSKTEFISDARAYMTDMPGFQAISWVDRNTVVQWVEPLAGNERALGLTLSFEKKRRDALRMARERKALVISEPLELVTVGQGLILINPVFENGELRGYILAALRIQRWMDYVFDLHGNITLSDDRLVSISFNDTVLFTQPGWERCAPEFTVSVAAAAADRQLIVTARPTLAFTVHNRTLLPAVVFAAGLVMSLLLSLIAYLYQKAAGERNALRRSEEKVRLLLNSTAEAIYGIDLNGNCTFANPACARMLGYPRPEVFIGKNMHELIHYAYPGGRPMPVQICRIFKAFREGKGTHVEDEVLWRADGTSFPVEYWSYPQFAGGIVSGAVVTFMDITERRQTLKLLADERQRVENILEGTNAGTWEWNVQTGAARFNARWAEIAGYWLSELEPTSIETWTMLAHPQDMRLSETLFEKHFKKELPYYECEVRMRHKNGSWVWVLSRGRVATWTKDGKPLIMSGTHQDITARKKIEAALKESRSRFKGIIETIADWIWEVDAYGRYTYASPQVTQLLGYEPREIIGKSPFDLMPLDEAQRVGEIFTRLLQEHQPIVNLENVNFHKNGSRVILETNGRPFYDDAGLLQGYRGVDRDITMRKRTERERDNLIAELRSALAKIPPENNDGT